MFETMWQWVMRLEQWSTQRIKWWCWVERTEQDATWRESAGCFAEDGRAKMASVDGFNLSFYPIDRTQRFSGGLQVSHRSSSMSAEFRHTSP